MKKLTRFFFCTQSPFMDKIIKNKKWMELVTSLSFSCKTCLDKFTFWADPLNLETAESKGKTKILVFPLKDKIFNISRIKRAFVLVIA